MLFIVVLLISLFAADGFAATTYYVSSVSGSNGNTGTSEEQAWQTADKVNGTSLQPGDTVLFKRGEQWLADPLIVPTSGTSGNVITFSAYGSGALPKFNGNNSVSFTDFVYGVVQVRGKSHIVIENFEITNTSRDLINIHSGAAPVTNVTIRNCLIHTINQDGWSALNILNFDEGTNNSLAEGRLNNILIEGNTVHTSKWNGIRVNGGATDVIIRNNISYNHPHNAIDVKQARTASSERNRRITIVGNQAYGSGDTAIFTVEAADVLIEKNRISTSVTGFKTHDIVGASSNITFQRNLVYSNDTALFIHGSVNTKVYHNTVYGNDLEITTSGNTGFVRANDLVYANISGNNFGQNPQFINPAAGDFGLQSTSPAINAGTNISLAFNGSLPDLGAHETIVFASCSVEDGDASTLRILFENNVGPPLAGISITGFSYRINSGSSNTMTAAQLNGTNGIYLTLKAPVTNGQTVDFSYDLSGSIRDSGLIGNNNNQRLNAITNQNCSNNVGAPPSATLTATHAQFRGLRSLSTTSTETTRFAIASIDQNVTVMPNAAFALRLKIACTAGDCTPLGVSLRYSKNAGSYTNIPDLCGADAIQFFGTSISATNIPVQGQATTEQLTSDHATNVVGMMVRSTGAIPTFDLSQNSEIELEYLLKLCSAVVGDTYDFRLYNQSGAVLDVYTVTPRAIVRRARLRM